jgi:hypothetical protein
MIRKKQTLKTSAEQCKYIARTLISRIHLTTGTSINTSTILHVVEDIVELRMGMLDMY